MDILERAKRICLNPADEWQVISQETTPAGTLISGYVLPLAAIGAIAGLIGGSLVGQTIPFLGTYRVPIATGVGVAVFSVAIAVAAVFVLSLVINVLAPQFGAQANDAQAFKVAVYSFTPAWLAGVFQIVPAFGILAILGGLYGIYLLYLGLPRLMRCPEERAVAYVAVVVIAAIVTNVVLTLGAGLVFGAASFSTAAVSQAAGSDAGAGEAADPESPLGRLQGLSEQLESSANRIDAAGRSGDQGAQVAAAMDGLGALFGGGKRFDPIDLDLLRPFVPETFAGLPRTRSSAEKTGIAALMMSKAEGGYGNGADKDVTLEVMDTGGASGLMSLASWAQLQGEREDDNGSERTQRVGSRIINEKISKQSGGTNEYSVVLADRFIVTARGRGVDLPTLRTEVSRLDLARLEGLKDEGAPQ